MRILLYIPTITPAARKSRELATGMGGLYRGLAEKGRVRRHSLCRRHDQPPHRRTGAPDIARGKPDVVGATAITPSIYKAERLLQIAKEVARRPSPCWAVSTRPSCTSRF